MSVQNTCLYINNNYNPSIQLTADCRLEQLIKRNDVNDDADIDKILKLHKGDFREFVILALNVKNYRAVNLLIKYGASLYQPLPTNLKLELQEEFANEFFKNKYYYGYDGQMFFQKTFESRSIDLAYGIAAHYYRKDPSALNILIEHPEFITLDVLKIFIEAGDTAAFNKIAPLFLNSPAGEKKITDLLHHTLRDFNFSLMGFNFDYILPRLEIIKSILVLNPNNRMLDKNQMSTFEIAQYLKTFLPQNAPPEFEAVLSKIMEDPTGYHEVRGIQRLLVNNLAVALNSEIANYPSVAQYIKYSVNSFLQQNNMPNDWIFVTPSKKFTTDQCINMIKNKEVLKFFTGWSSGFDIGHGINVVIYDHYLCVCNRGSGVDFETSGVCIYDIQDDTVLKRIIPLFLERSQENQKFICNQLRTDPQIKFLTSIKLKFQRVGNCVWLSEKIGTLPCFIASYLKQGLALEDAIVIGKKIYKDWSRSARIHLLNSYLDHPYHYRDSSQNEKEGIIFGSIILNVLKRAPRSVKSKYNSLLFNKLADERLKKSLGEGLHSQLFFEVLFGRIEVLLELGDTSSALSALTQLSTLSQFFDVNVPNVRGQMLLHLACQHGRLDFVTELLNRGANPSIVFNNKVPLEYLIENYDNYEDSVKPLAKELIERMIATTDFDAAAKKKGFPLMVAIQKGNEFCVDEMLKKGIYFKEYYLSGKAVFHSAVESKSENICKKVLSVCSDLQIPNGVGETLLHLAVERKKINVVKILLDLGADPNALNLYEMSPLDYVEQDFQPELFKLLVDHGAMKSEREKKYFSPADIIL